MVLNFLFLGNFFLVFSKSTINSDRVINSCLAVVLGQGIFIILILFLGAFGLFTKKWLIVISLLTFILGSIFLLTKEINSGSINYFTDLKMTLNHWLSVLLVLLFAVPALLTPFRITLPSDETAYHLPHALEWARSGSITINEWLRYPWFPFNYNLLYSSAILIYDETLSHMLNTLAGLLIALLVYRIGVKHFTQSVAVVATVIWLQLDRGDFGKAYVDFGLTLYVFSSFIVFYSWEQNRADTKLLFLSSLFLGVALGTKYQTLLFLPLFVLSVVYIDRRLSSWFISCIGLVIPSAYWYVRNFLITGDPFDPFGGHIFGFYDWNLEDYAGQFKDLARQADWPRYELWPSLLALWPIVQSRSKFKILCLILSIYFFFLWYVTSKYPRYLMPIFPILALLSAEQACLVFTFFLKKMLSLISFKPLLKVKVLPWVFIFSAFFLSSLASIRTSLSLITIGGDERNILFRARIPIYPLIEFLNSHSSGRTYAVDFNDYKYYVNMPVWGDVFGPWRYKDIVSSDPLRFSRKLNELQFQKVIVPQQLATELESYSNFSQSFSKIFQGNGFVLYSVLDTSK